MSLVVDFYFDHFVTNKIDLLGRTDVLHEFAFCFPAGSFGQTTVPVVFCVLGLLGGCSCVTGKQMVHGKDILLPMTAPTHVNTGSSVMPLRALAAIPSRLNGSSSETLLLDSCCLSKPSKRGVETTRGLWVM